MSYQAIQDHNITINLLQAAKDTGWSIDGNLANHETCQTGRISLIGYPLIPGHVYQISYSIISISGGFVRAYAGTNAGPARTTTGLYVETITANGTLLTYLSDANCQIQQFNIRDTADDTSPTQQNTIVYSALLKKWTDYRTFAPEQGWSLFINTFTMHYGKLYNHLNDSQNNRNNFYGVQFDTRLKFVENKNASSVKTYLSISLQCNELLITTTDGITTSLGHVSELIAQDFLKYSLVDGIVSVDVYTAEGIYSASFLRDKTENIISGESLKGNYAMIELITANGAAVLRLFTIGIVTSTSKVGAR